MDKDIVVSWHNMNDEYFRFYNELEESSYEFLSIEYDDCREEIWNDVNDFLKTNEILCDGLQKVIDSLFATRPFVRIYIILKHQVSVVVWTI